MPPGLPVGEQECNHLSPPRIYMYSKLDARGGAAIDPSHTDMENREPNILLTFPTSSFLL